MREGVIPGLRQSLGAANLSIGWVDYKPSHFGLVFQNPSTLRKVVTQADRGLRPDKGLPADIIESAKKGAQEAAQQIVEQAQHCPDQRFILSGYSEGAWVLGDALQSPAVGSYYDRIDEVLLFGDPKFDSTSPAAHRPSSLRQEGPPQAIGAAAYGIERRKPYLPPDLEDRAQSYCYGGPGTVDPVCAAPGGNPSGGQGTPVTPLDWGRAMHNCGVSRRYPPSAQDNELAVENKLRLLDAINAALNCGHMKYTGVYATQYTYNRELQGQVARSVTVTVPATGGWHPTGLTVEKGQKVQITRVSGNWTVDAAHQKRVGPAGYSADDDAQIPAGCKLDEGRPYGQMLAGVEEFRADDLAYSANGNAGTFTAPAAGNVELTINDTCQDNNAGLITVRVEILPS